MCDHEKEKPLNAYEQKLARRRERLEAAAARKRGDAALRFGKADAIGSMIPFGQPVMIGHHSERRHRRDLERIDDNMRKGVGLLADAEVLEAQAEAVGTGGISADDPEAITKLQHKLRIIEAQHARMLAANKLIRKQDRAGLVAMGYGEEEAETLLRPGFGGYVGYAPYVLSNNTAEIRRVKHRIADLKQQHAMAETMESQSGDGWSLEADVDSNRLVLRFTERLSKEHYDLVRRGGFVWARSRGAFVRQLNVNAWRAAKGVLQQLGKV